MSDVDSLDGILDDVDMDALLMPSTSSNENKKLKEQDLDDCLDDFFNDQDSKQPSCKSSSAAGKSNEEDIISDDIDDDGGLCAHIKLQKSHELERALHTLPDAEMKNKWMNILINEVKLDDMPSVFKHSYAYLEQQDTVEHFAIDKSLRNLILRACSKSNMSDAQAKQLQDDLFHDQDLLKKYRAEIIKEKTQDIKTCEDFSPEKYPALWKSIS